MRLRILLWSSVFAGAVLGGCTPNVEHDASSTSGAVVVEFDPSVPVVPLPNDLARNPVTGKVAVPSSPTDTPAQQEYNQAYLNTLSGFPFESTGQVQVTGDLAPSSVNAQSVVAFDVTASQPIGITPAVVGRSIVVPPPTAGWSRAHQIALAIIGGANGVRGAHGETVLPSPAWALVSSQNSLVTCSDLTAANCQPTVDVLPSTATDTPARLAAQTSEAIALEGLRRGLAPIINLFTSTLQVKRSDILVAWTFTVVDAGEMTFDPAAGVLPFPNDVLRTGPQGTVSLPNPTTGLPLSAADCAGTDPTTALFCGLDTLDGFSTLAPPVSENSASLGAASQAHLDGQTIDATTVGLLPIASNAPTAIQTQPKWTPCLNCKSSSDANGTPQASPQELQWSLDAPLDERTTYVGYVTDNVKDDQGVSVVANPVFALLRLTQPLVDAAGQPTVNVLSAAQAAALEPLRQALSPVFAALESAGVSREHVTLAFPFTTQSEGSLLDALSAYPATVPSAPAIAQALVDVTAPFKAALPAGTPLDSVGNVYSGSFLSPVAVTGPGGTLDTLHPTPLPVPFTLALPRAAAPGGAGVVLFGHGFTRGRGDFVAIANAIASTGMAVIAADTLDHGDRSSCTGSSIATGLITDDASCGNPTLMRCDEDPLLGLCVLRDDASRASCVPGPGAMGDGACAATGQGRCAVDGKCQGAGADLLRENGLPVISGWNIFSVSNFFATRDNFRQVVIDLSQLVRVIQSRDTSGIVARMAAIHPGDTLATGQIHYVGQSLGGIVGTLFNAVSPETIHVALNVPGGALPQIILNAPSFATQKAAFLGALAAQGIFPGTPQFDQFMATVQWILDPADPANMAYRLTHGVDAGRGLAPNANRSAFIQFIEGDQTIPEVSSLALLTGANRTFTPAPPTFGCLAPLYCYEFTEAGDGFNAMTATPATRHGFLLSPPQGGGGLSLTAKAQSQVATLLATGSLP